MEHEISAAQTKVLKNKDFFLLFTSQVVYLFF